MFSVLRQHCCRPKLTLASAKHCIGVLTIRKASCSSTRKVLVSTSTDIYENLALENWLYEKADLENESILLLWKNKPVVVFGRHQNPWVECNVPKASTVGIDLARRNSGGGTVYHDEGNLNVSFLKDKSLYDRKQNLQLVVDAIKTKWDVDLRINEREDIVMNNNYKISGTASKLGRNRTYHHFTLLYNVDKDRLNSILYSNIEGVSSRATTSTRMSVANLEEVLDNVDYDSLVHVITETFLKEEKDFGANFVNPMDESLFPGVAKHCEQIKSWEWIYGKTPPFSIQRHFNNLINNIDHRVNINTDIVKGKIHNLNINVMEVKSIDARVFVMLKVGLEETRLDRHAVAQSLSQIKMDWISNKLYTVETREMLDWLLLCVLETLALQTDEVS